MRKVSVYLIIGALAIGGWMFLQGNDSIIGMVQQYVENGEFITLKARYTPEQIMEDHKQELLVDEHHSFREAGLIYHPYLLMEVKYFQPDKKSREGSALWSYVDGEMVINADTWEKTHGFEDAINVDATRNDFKLMQALAKSRGASTVDRLQKDLGIDKDAVQQWIASALSKHLIVQKGNEVQLHIQDPRILVQPETKMSGSFVKKPYSHSQRISSKYSKNQIQKIGKAAFGEDFTVRSTTEIFLPVYTIEVVNPDGSILTTYWNALNGQRMIPRSGVPGWL